MNPLPLPENLWKNRWKVARAWDVLHRVARIDEVIEPEDYDDEPVHIVGVTCCGIEGPLSMPGVFSRLGLSRCPDCCEIVGVPEGLGMPGNHGIPEIPGLRWSAFGQEWSA